MGLFSKKQKSTIVPFEAWHTTHFSDADAAQAPSVASSSTSINPKKRKSSVTGSLSASFLQHAAIPFIHVNEKRKAALRWINNGYARVSQDDTNIELTTKTGPDSIDTLDDETTQQRLQNFVRRKQLVTDATEQVKRTLAVHDSLVHHLEFVLLFSKTFYHFLAFSRNMISATWMIAKGTWEALQHLNKHDFPSEIFFGLKLAQGLLCVINFVLTCIRDGKLPNDKTDIAWAAAASYRAVIGGLAFFGILAGPAAMLAIISSCSFDGIIEAFHIYQYTQRERDAKNRVIDIFSSIPENTRTTMSEALSLSCAERDNYFEALTNQSLIDITKTPSPSEFKDLLHGAHQPAIGPNKHAQLHKYLKTTGSKSAETMARALNRFLFSNPTDRTDKIDQTTSVAWWATAPDNTFLTALYNDHVALSKKESQADSASECSEDGMTLVETPARAELYKAYQRCLESEAMLKQAPETFESDEEAFNKAVAAALIRNSRDTVAFANALETYRNELSKDDQNTITAIDALLKSGNMVRANGAKVGPIVAVAPNTTHAAIALFTAVCDAREAHLQKRYWTLAFISELMGIVALATLTFFIPMIVCQPVASAVLITSGVLLAVLMFWMGASYFRNEHREHTDQVLLAEMLTVPPPSLATVPSLELGGINDEVDAANDDGTTAQHDSGRTTPILAV